MATTCTQGRDSFQGGSQLGSALGGSTSYIEYQHAHIEVYMLGAKTHQAEAGNADSSSLMLCVYYQRHQGRSTTSSSSADGWHVQGVAHHRVKVATPSWDVGPHQEGASSLRSSSGFAIQYGTDCGTAANYEEASIQCSLHNEAAERLEMVEVGVKSSVCEFKAQGVQGVRTKHAEHSHQLRAAKGHRNVPGRPAQQQDKAAD